MLDPPHRQAQSALLPVLPGHADALEALLERVGAGLRNQLARAPGLHFARLALLHAAPGERSLLLLGTTFDGSLAEHWSELWQVAGAELAELLVHCEGGEAVADVAAFSAHLQGRVVAAGASFAAHAGLRVERVREDAQLRARVASLLDAERDELVSKQPEEIARVLRERCGATRLEPEAQPSPEGLDTRRPSLASVVGAHAFGLAYLLVRSLWRELVDGLGALWHDVRPPPRTSLIPPALGSSASLDVARSFVHVARLKPGRFRRSALRFALRVTHELGRTEEARAFGSAAAVHGARFHLLEDGRLVTLSDHAGSALFGLHAVVDRASTLVTLVASQTLGFPPNFGWRFGGARDQARFERWVRAGEVRSGVEYAAYPELGVREIGDNAELRTLLAGPAMAATPATHLLGLLKD